MNRNDFYEFEELEYYEKRKFHSLEINIAPQFTFDDLYIIPFSKKRVFDENGNVHYIAIERNFSPSGIHLLDELVKEIYHDTFSAHSFCKERKLEERQLQAFVTILTGMTPSTLFTRWKIRNALMYLRYTDMDIGQVAIESGFRTSGAMRHALQSTKELKPTTLRRFLQQKNDLGRYIR